MTDPVPDDLLTPVDLGHNARVEHFDTEVAPQLEAFRLQAANDPTSALRRLYETGEKVDPDIPAIRRILQRVAAGVVECQLISRLPLLHARWPEAPNALAHRELCRLMTGVKIREIERAGEMLGASVMSATREAAAVLGEAFDAGAWAEVLVEVLVHERIPRTGDVIDIETLRLIRAGRD